MGNIPDQMYFMLLYREFRSIENEFEKTRAKQQIIISKVTEIDVVDHFDAYPTYFLLYHLKYKNGQHKFLP